MALSVEDPTILQEAESLINGDRQQQYGGASESFTRIGELWGAYLGAPVSALDVANLMVLLKVSRTKGKYHRDSYVDIAGYSALAERITAEDATLGVLIDTPLEYVEAFPRYHVWNHLNDVPLGTKIKDKDGDSYHSKGEDWYWSVCTSPLTPGQVDRFSDSYAPFTEVLEDQA